MLLAGNWFTSNKKIFIFLLLIHCLYANPKRFYVEDFLAKKNFRKTSSSENVVQAIEYKKKNIQITIIPYNYFFQINQHLYHLQRIVFYDEKGLSFSLKDKEIFEKIINFYEKKFNQPTSATLNLSAPNQPNKTNPLQPSSPTKPKNKDQEKKKIGLKPINAHSDSAYNTSQNQNKINYIFLDPGHGGKDPGAIFYGYKEKDLVLKLTLRLYKILKKKSSNIKIVLTRRKDHYLNLETRTHLANSRLKVNENGIFISTHLNIWLNPKTRGLEVYYLDNDKKIFERRVNDLYLLENNIKNQEYTVDYFQKIFSFFKVNQFQNESRYLAEKIISKTFVQVTDYPIARGVKKETFYVLNGTLMPAILLELGFISNQQDLEFLLNKKKSNLLLETIAQSVMDYVNEFNTTNGFRNELFLFKFN